MHCLIDIFSKYTWIVLIKDKKGIKSPVNLKQLWMSLAYTKQWVYQGSQFYNGSMKSWPLDKGIKMYSTYNEGKSTIAGKFIRTLKSKIQKHMTAV